MTVFYLKLIALITMLIDHTGFVFQYTFDTHNLRIIGRISFPIFAFLIAEGTRHTKSIEKYLLRLLCFAFISEIPFDMILSNVNSQNKGFPILFDISHQNVFFTLLIGAAAIYVYKKLGLIKGFIPAILILFTATALNTDYGTVGAALIFVVYIALETNKKMAHIIPLLLFVIYMYGSGLPYLASASVAILFIAAYNGEKGVGLKWLFYLAYPVHMMILYAIWVCL